MSHEKNNGKSTELLIAQAPGFYIMITYDDKSQFNCIVRSSEEKQYKVDRHNHFI